MINNISENRIEKNFQVLFNTETIWMFARCMQIISSLIISSLITASYHNS